MASSLDVYAYSFRIYILQTIHTSSVSFMLIIRSLELCAQPLRPRYDQLQRKLQQLHHNWANKDWVASAPDILAIKISNHELGNPNIVCAFTNLKLLLVATMVAAVRQIIRHRRHQSKTVNGPVIILNQLPVVNADARSAPGGFVESPHSGRAPSTLTHHNCTTVRHRGARIAEKSGPTRLSFSAQRWYSSTDVRIVRVRSSAPFPSPANWYRCQWNVVTGCRWEPKSSLHKGIRCSWLHKLVSA